MESERDASASLCLSRWSRETEQRRYSSRLLDALRRVRPSSSAATRGRLLHESADGALAVAARGRTLWSRAVLSRRAIKLKSSPRRLGTVSFTKRSGITKKMIKRKKRQVIESKAKVLGRLVPGAAMQMQVRALSTLKQIFSGDAPQDRSVTLLRNSNL